VAMSVDSMEIDHADVCAALHLPKSARAGPSALSASAPSEIKPLAQHTRDYVEWVLKQLGGNKSRAARVLGIDRATLQRKLQNRNDGL